MFEFLKVSVLAAIVSMTPAAVSASICEERLSQQLLEHILHNGRYEIWKIPEVAEKYPDLKTITEIIEWATDISKRVIENKETIELTSEQRQMFEFANMAMEGIDEIKFHISHILPVSSEGKVWNCSSRVEFRIWIGKESLDGHLIVMYTVTPLSPTSSSVQVVGVQ